MTTGNFLSTLRAQCPHLFNGADKTSYLAGQTSWHTVGVNQHSIFTMRWCFLAHRNAGSLMAEVLAAQLLYLIIPCALQSQTCLGASQYQLIWLSGPAWIYPWAWDPFLGVLVQTFSYLSYSSLDMVLRAKCHIAVQILSASEKNVGYILSWKTELRIF